MHLHFAEKVFLSLAEIFRTVLLFLSPPLLVSARSVINVAPPMPGACQKSIIPYPLQLRPSSRSPGTPYFSLLICMGLLPRIGAASEEEENDRRSENLSDAVPLYSGHKDMYHGNTVFNLLYSLCCPFPCVNSIPVLPALGAVRWDSEGRNTRSVSTVCGKAGPGST